MVNVQRTVTPAVKLTGDIRVPGEVAEATRTLVLASLSEGESQVDNAPPGIATLVETLGRLGVELRVSDSTVRVRGRGLRSLTAPPSEVGLGGIGDAALLLLTALARVLCRHHPRGAGHSSPRYVSLTRRRGDGDVGSPLPTSET